MCDRGFRQGGVEGWNLSPRHCWNMLFLVTLIAEQSAGLVGCLQVDVVSERRRMHHADAEAGQRLPRGNRLRVPDWLQSVANVRLVNLLNGPLAEPRQHGGLERAEPTASLAVVFELGFLAFEGGERDVAKCVAAASRIAAK